jgi:hypothetical protein
MEEQGNEEDKVITLEGTWEEDISIEEIHEQVLEKLKEEIDELKERYRHMTTGTGLILGQDMRILKKITSIRLKHDRLVANARHIFDELSKLRSNAGNPTPCTRLVWMNHIQEYFRYLNDMFHIDVSLNRISPGLFRSAKITGAETPGTFHKKRRMTIILQKLIDYEKTNNKKTTFNTRMKKYCTENLITVPKRFLDPSTGCNHGKGFPDRWLDMFAEDFRGYFSRSRDTVYRWYLLFSLIGSETFARKMDFHGLCPACSYPFLSDKSLKAMTHAENKLSCKECMKEIDWTYFASEGEMKIMRNFLHPQVLGDIDKIIMECSPSTKQTSEPMVEIKKPLTNKHITLIHDDIPDTVTTTTTTTTMTMDEQTIDEKTSNSNEKPARKRGRRKEHDIDKLIHIAREELKSCPIYTEKQPIKNDEEVSDKNYDSRIKDSAMNLLTELKNLQGVSLDKIPHGVFQTVESYLMRTYKVPVREEIRKEPVNEKGERVVTINSPTPSVVTVSRRMVLEALRECGLGKWSSHISHIMATVWWCPYPKVEYEDEERMIVLFVKQREIFERIKDKFARKTNLSIHTATRKLLAASGYPIEDTDFKIWETQDSKKKQDVMWEECIKVFSKS